MLRTNLDHALDLAQRGFHVFPLRPNAKEPATPHGHTDATTDADTIRQLWRVYGDECGIGIACAPSGVFVVDIDFRNGGRESINNWEREHGQLPPHTLAVSTPGGVHLYFEAPEGIKLRGKLCEGVDVKYQGYVVAPPSIHPSGKPYVWIAGADDLQPAPPHLLAAVEKRAPEVPSSNVSPQFEPASLELLNSIRQELAEFKGGAYEAACRLVNDYALTPEEALPILYDWDASWEGGPRDKEWLIGRIKSALNYAAGDRGHARIATSIAEEFGGSSDSDPLAQLIERFGSLRSESSSAEVDPLELIRAAMEEIKAWRAGGGGQESGPRLWFESAANLLDRTFPPTNWLVRGVIPGDGMGAVAGEPKSTKTWAAIELALAVATNTPAFGEFETGPARPVVLFLTEDSLRGSRNRLRALVSARKGDARRLLRNVHIECRASANLGDDITLAQLIASVRALPGPPPALLVLDPLRELHTGNEDSSQEMADIMGRLRALRDILGVSVLFVHHSAKTSADVSKRRRGQKMRGSGAIHGAVDFGFYLGDVDTDGTHTSTSAECEIKAARGAGVFRLDLTVEDDTNGEAIKATWQVRRDEGPGNDSEKESNRVVDALAAEPQQTATVKKLQSILSIRYDRLNALLAGLEKKGWVTKAFRGSKPAGWTLNPAIAAARAAEEDAKNRRRGLSPS